MNILQLAHAQIRSRFYTRIGIALFYYGGLILMFASDWKIALGVLLFVTALRTKGELK
jgi:hypothetical protein